MNKIEKQFFDTFDIQYEFCSDTCLNPCKFQCDDCELRTERYPQITDSILLKLICIANQYEYYPTSTNIKNIQARTLRILLKAKKYLKDTYLHQGCHNSLVRKVRTLFEEV